MKAIFLTLSAFFSLTMLGQNAVNNGLHQQLIETRANNSWQNFQRSTFTSDANDYIQHIQGELWNIENSEWNTEGQVFYTITADGYIDTVVNQQWDSATQGWVNSSNTIWAYNSNDQILLTSSQIWTGSAWQNVTKTSYTYNGQSQLASSLQQGWSVATNAWVDNVQTSYTNDSVGNATQSVSQYYNPVLGTWVLSQRHTNTYNTDNTISHNLVEANNSGVWVNSSQTNSFYENGKITEAITDMWINNVWSPYNRVTYLYNALGIKEQNISKVSVYPNPATDKIYVSAPETFKSVAVYGIDGKKHNLEASNNSVDVSSLSAGTYILLAETDKETGKVKFIKK